MIDSMLVLMECWISVVKSERTEEMLNRQGLIMIGRERQEYAGQNWNSRIMQRRCKSEHVQHLSNSPSTHVEVVHESKIGGIGKSGANEGG